VTAEDAAGRTAMTQLGVIPRVSLSAQEVPAGTEVQVDLSGFAADEAVELLLEDRDDGAAVVVGSATVAEDGRVSVVVSIPTDTVPGDYQLRAFPVRADRGSASAALHISADATPIVAP
jgi:hypothetical protein